LYSNPSSKDGLTGYGEGSEWGYRTPAYEISLTLRGGARSQGADITGGAPVKASRLV